MKPYTLKLADDVENSETLTDNYGKVWVKVEAGLCEEACDELRRLHKHTEALQATIDALMLEYCPQDMSVEQIVNWSNHQRKEKA
jgi:hypothetical protein